jgi:hypothetical protein
MLREAEKIGSGGTKVSAAGPLALALAVGLGIAVSLSGCAVGPQYKGPPATKLTDFHNSAAIDSRHTEAPAPPVETWWTGFDDPVLTRIVERALEQNLDLAAALARVVRPGHNYCPLPARQAPRAHYANPSTARSALSDAICRVTSAIKLFTTLT